MDATREKNVSETHHIVGTARGEPLPEGRVGARVRIPLSGAPSPRWSRALSAQLANALTGHAAVGHLHLDQLVQGSDLVLEGVEEDEAPVLGPCLERAVDATNACVHADGEPSPTNMPRDAAEKIATEVYLD
jgi:hypothetical protein